MSVTLRLNIGSGSIHIPGFIDWDIVDGAAAFPLPFGNGTVQEIRASHVLEHLTFTDAKKALAEWNRVLVNDGTIRVAVPDFDKAAEDKENPLRLFYVMGGQTNEHDIHRSAWTRDKLSGFIAESGFEIDGDWVSEAKDCASLPVSLNIKATKKAPAVPKICVITNVPRLGFQAHFGCLHESFGKLGIPIRTTQGVYWAQCMTRGIEKAIEDGFDWAFFVDYDSVFTGWHVRALIETMRNHPEIDALAPIQTQRQSDLVMLVGEDGSTEQTMDVTQPTPVKSAHFGLTLMRLNIFEKIERPWFIDRPDASGSYNDGRVDADVDFWRKLRAAGGNLSVVAGVSIGHIEAKVSYFNVSTGQVECVNVKDWISNHAAWGVPTWVE